MAVTPVGIRRGTKNSEREREKEPEREEEEKHDRIKRERCRGKKETKTKERKVSSCPRAPEKAPFATLSGWSSLAKLHLKGHPAAM